MNLYTEYVALSYIAFFLILCLPIIYIIIQEKQRKKKAKITKMFHQMDEDNNSSE